MPLHAIDPSTLTPDTVVEIRFGDDLTVAYASPEGYRYWAAYGQVFPWPSKATVVRAFLPVDLPEPAPVAPNSWAAAQGATVTVTRVPQDAGVMMRSLR